MEKVLVDIRLYAGVVVIPGNQNMLYLSVTEVFCNGTVNVILPNVEGFIWISNNAIGTYKVGPYNVYVNTKGNDQIRELYLVG